MIYDVIAASKNVRVYKIPKTEMRTKVPPDVLTKLENAIWPRLNYMRDRLLELHETRTEIVGLDKMSSALPLTYKHMQEMYPNSTKSLQNKFRITTLANSGGNTDLLLFSDNRSKDM